jgi:hypothetical protein
MYYLSVKTTGTLLLGGCAVFSKKSFLYLQPKNFGHPLKKLAKNTEKSPKCSFQGAEHTFQPISANTSQPGRYASNILEGPRRIDVGLAFVPE